MIEIFGHRHSPYTQRVLFFLEEIHKEYEFHPIKLEKKEHFKPYFRKLSLFQRVPVLKYGSLVLSESQAILRYFAEKFQAFSYYPRNLELRADIDQWMDHCSSHIGNHMTQLAWEFHWKKKFGLKKSNEQINRIVTKLEKELPLIDCHLSNRTYLNQAKVSLADVSFLPLMLNSKLTDFSLEKYPFVRSWCDRMEARAAWQKLAFYQ